MALILERPRTRLPPAPATLNSAHPAFWGLEKLWVPSHGRAYGRQASVMTPVGSLESYAGGVTGFSTTNYLKDAAFDRLAASGDSTFTFLFSARRRGTLTAYTAYVHKSDVGSGGSGNGRDLIFADVGGGMQDISFSWRGVRHIVYSYLITGGSPFLVDVMKPSTYVITGNNTTIISAYCDGKDCSAGIIAGGGSADWDSQQIFPVLFGAGWNDGVVQASDSDLVIDMVGIWPLRQCSPSIARSLSINPSQLFAPRSILLPHAAAAGLPTLSSSTYKPGTLTGSGWTPRITAS